MDPSGEARGSKSARAGKSPDRAAGQSRAVPTRPSRCHGGTSEGPHWRSRRSTGDVTDRHMANARSADRELEVVGFHSELHTGLVLTCGTGDGQAISKKRERQVGEAQGALVVAQAQVSGLETQVQELTAGHKQASMQYTLSDLESATTSEHATSRLAYSSSSGLFGIVCRVQKLRHWLTAVSWHDCAQHWRLLNPKLLDTITPSRSPAHRLRHAASCLCKCHSKICRLLLLLNNQAFGEASVLWVCTATAIHACRKLRNCSREQSRLPLILPRRTMS